MVLSGPTEFGDVVQYGVVQRSLDTGSFIETKGALTQSNIYHSYVKLCQTAPTGINQSFADFYYKQPAVAHLLTQGHNSEVPYSNKSASLMDTEGTKCKS